MLLYFNHINYAFHGIYMDYICLLNYCMYIFLVYIYFKCPFGLVETLCSFYRPLIVVRKLLQVCILPHRFLTGSSCVDLVETR